MCVFFCIFPLNFPLATCQHISSIFFVIFVVVISAEQIASGMAYLETMRVIHRYGPFDHVTFKFSKICLSNFPGVFDVCIYFFSVNLLFFMEFSCVAIWLVVTYWWNKRATSLLSRLPILGCHVKSSTCTKLLARNFQWNGQVKCLEISSVIRSG